MISSRISSLSFATPGFLQPFLIRALLTFMFSFLELCVDIDIENMRLTLFLAEVQNLKWLPAFFDIAAEVIQIATSWNQQFQLLPTHFSNHTNVIISHRCWRGLTLKSNTHYRFLNETSLAFRNELWRGVQFTTNHSTLFPSQAQRCACSYLAKLQIINARKRIYKG